MCHSHFQLTLVWNMPGDAFPAELPGTIQPVFLRNPPMGNTLLEQAVAADELASADAAKKYRELLARASKPAAGDAAELAAVRGVLGLTLADVQIDLAALARAAELAGKVEGHTAEDFVSRQTAAGQALEKHRAEADQRRRSDEQKTDTLIGDIRSISMERDAWQRDRQALADVQKANPRMFPEAAASAAAASPAPAPKARPWGSSHQGPEAEISQAMMHRA
jgi:hypothetical protein